METEPEKQPQPKEMKHYLELLAAQGFDFVPSDLEHLEAMDNDELTEYFFQTLLEAGHDDPEGFMVEHALVEGFRALNTEEVAARNTLETTGQTHTADMLDEQERN